MTDTSSATSRGPDPFKIATVLIPGRYPIAKTPDGRQPSTQLEFAFGPYLGFHPLVVSYQRGDLSPSFAHSHKLDLPLGTHYANSYAFENASHVYLPDYVGTLADGGLLIAKAGQVEEKSPERARAKLEATRHLAELKGGALRIGTEENLSRLRQQNLVFLHARRQDFLAFTDIAGHVAAVWQAQDLSIAEIMRQLAERLSAAVVKAAAWTLVADATAQGRLAVDLASIRLRRATSPSPCPPLRSPSPRKAALLQLPAPYSQARSSRRAASYLLKSQLAGCVMRC